MNDYAQWIVAYLHRHNSHVLGACLQACEEMRKQFPELLLIRGHVHCAWGKRGHVWLTTPTGQIVDPTAQQFPDWTTMTYEGWNPGNEVKIGRCMNCGRDIWRSVSTLTDVPHEEFCSEACSAEMAAELTSPRASSRP